MTSGSARHSFEVSGIDAQTVTLKAEARAMTGPADTFASATSALTLRTCITRGLSHFPSVKLGGILATSGGLGRGASVVVSAEVSAPGLSLRHFGTMSFGLNQEGSQGIDAGNEAVRFPEGQFPVFLPQGGVLFVGIAVNASVSGPNGNAVSDFFDSLEVQVRLPGDPVADAGDDQTVWEGSLVVLDGSGSFDPEGDPLIYHWAQIAGPPVPLSDPTAVQPSFSAAPVRPEGAVLAFALTVSDGVGRAIDTVDVRVEHVNHPPIAHVGQDQTKDEGSLVTLDGTASSDPDADPLTYTWIQLSGPPVALSDAHSPTPTFTAPQVGPGGGQLVFQLVVSDGELASEPALVTITVLDLNDPPACEVAQASPARIWPPNHEWIPVEILGVADPNNDRVTITVTGVTQDEPTNGLGDGDTSPDAVVQGGTVLLRAKRAGTGNGRVYQVSFLADDGFGGRCTGSVVVCVPHSRQAGTCVDDGQRYSSTQP
jgi:hypothetical protein